MTRIFSLPRAYKRAISMLIDTFFICVSFILAFVVRLENDTVIIADGYHLLLLILIIVTLTSNVKLGLYRAILRFINTQAAATVSLSALASTITLVISALWLDIEMPLGVPLIYFSFFTLMTGGSRLVIRASVMRPAHKDKLKVIIYGAGSSGRQLANSLLLGNEYTPVAFVDDNSQLHKHNILGVKVLSPNQLQQLLKKYDVKRILLAMPSNSKLQNAKILSSLEHLGIEVLTIPGTSDLVSGQAKIDELHEVAIEDLLGRDPVEPNVNLLEANIKDKVVLVTGAGGSIGSELCRQILKLQPNKLVVFERSEFSLYSLDSELRKLLPEGSTVEIIPLIGSVQHQDRLEVVMTTFNVDTVYHAAAFKHVPIVEHNVVEGVRNNVFGTLYAAQAAINSNVETFVLISTDKAVRPTNVMGTTKRMAELILQALADTGSNTRFCMVRFGNVLGSSGSVVPLFQKQIKQGGPVTLTHPEITRYFMTIPEAAQLVIQAGAMGKGGDVFVLDMGDPVKIIDLATKMIHLSGLQVKTNPDAQGDIEIKCTGLRPGEKLYEELLIGDEVLKTDHPRIMTASEVWLSWPELDNLLKELDQACYKFDHAKIRKLLLEAPTGFTPKDGICDLVWQAHQTSSIVEFSNKKEVAV